MIVDQDEIEALLAQAGELADEAAPMAATAAEVPAAEPAADQPAMTDAPPEVARILRIRVPVIVRLASRWMSIAKVRKLSLGMIIEFHKHVDEPLELLVNNHLVGNGEAVKANEHFGLRVSEIRDKATRIRSMGQ
jgi:flagellar motor switch protein FliN/FliY